LRGQFVLLALAALLVCSSGIGPRIAPHVNQPATAYAASPDDESGGIPRATEFLRGYRPKEESISSVGDLRREIEAFLQGSEGSAGVALVTNPNEILLDVDSDVSMPLASVAKLYILAAYLSNLELEGRPWRADEADLFEALITYSDNGSADYLWQLIGGAEGMQAFFDREKLAAGSPGNEGFWGGTVDSAADTAILLARLDQGRLLGPNAGQYVLGLLGTVVEYQRWGVAAGLRQTSDEQDMVLLKDGWYPGEEGWRVNSAGVVHPGHGGPAYALVVLTDNQPSFDYGVETVETIATLVNHFMRSTAPVLQASR